MTLFIVSKLKVKKCDLSGNSKTVSTQSLILTNLKYLILSINKYGSQYLSNRNVRLSAF
jgi:hypothetical protein